MTNNNPHNIDWNRIDAEAGAEDSIVVAIKLEDGTVVDNPRWAPFKVSGGLQPAPHEAAGPMREPTAEQIAGWEREEAEEEARIEAIFNNGKVALDKIDAGHAPTDEDRANIGPYLDQMAEWNRDAYRPRDLIPYAEELQDIARKLLKALSTAKPRA